MEQDDEKIVNDMDNIELQADISGNSTTMLALAPPKLPIRKRASSTHTDYESDEEY